MVRPNVEKMRKTLRRERARKLRCGLIGPWEWYLQEMQSRRDG